MLMHLTPLSSEPIHEQIARQLADKILADQIPLDEPLPPARILASRLKVSARAVQRAYRQLHDAGLLREDAGQLGVAHLTAEQKQRITRQRLLDHQSPLSVIDLFSQKLAEVYDPDQLFIILRDILQAHVMSREVHMALLDETTGVYQLRAVASGDRPFIIDAQDSGWHQISRIKAPMRQSELGPDRPDKHSLFGELHARNVQVVFPLRNQGRLLGFIGLSDKKNGAAYTLEDYNLVLVLVNQFMAALTTAKFYVEAMEKRRMEEEMMMARQIQANLLPKSLPHYEQADLAVYCQPTTTIGGDFYDCFEIEPGVLALIIADACGKGLPAAMLISQIQAMLHSEIDNQHDLQTVMKHLNRQICRFTPRDKFVTLFFARYDVYAQTLEYTSAGHNYPVVFRANGEYEFLQHGGPGLGIFDEAEFSTTTIRLQPDDVLYLYTDGVTETMSVKREEYGEQRLINILRENREAGADELVNATLADLAAFRSSAPLHDDRTMLILKVN